MSSDTQELIDLCEQLPEAKRAEVADFARFLLAKRDDVTPGRNSSQAIIRHTEGVVGGDACVRDTRIAVWTLVEFKKRFPRSHAATSVVRLDWSIRKDVGHDSHHRYIA